MGSFRQFSDCRGDRWVLPLSNCVDFGESEGRWVGGFAEILTVGPGEFQWDVCSGAFEMRGVSRWSVLGCDGEAQVGAATHRDDVLDTAFAVAFFAEDCRSLEILKRPSSQFISGSRVAVNEDGERVFTFAALAVASCEELLGFTTFPD